MPELTNVQGVDLDSFQDEFDLDEDIAEGVQPRNNFDSVADAVRAKYPHLISRASVLQPARTNSRSLGS